MPAYQYLGGLPVGESKDTVYISLHGPLLRFDCPGVLGFGRWAYDLPLASIEAVRLDTDRKVLGIEASPDETLLHLCLRGKLSDLHPLYQTLLRACPWVGTSDERADLAEQHRGKPLGAASKLSARLDSILILGLLTVLVLLALALVIALRSRPVIGLAAQLWPPGQYVTDGAGIGSAPAGTGVLIRLNGISTLSYGCEYSSQYPSTLQIDSPIASRHWST